MAEKAQDHFLTIVFTLFLGAVTWAFRRLFTSQEQIDLLRAELASQRKTLEAAIERSDELLEAVEARRDRLRVEDREALGEVRAGVKRIEDWMIRGTPR